MTRDHRAHRPGRRCAARERTDPRGGRDSRRRSNPSRTTRPRAIRHACRQRAVSLTARSIARGDRLRRHAEAPAGPCPRGARPRDAPDLARDHRDAARHRLDDRVGQAVRERRDGRARRSRRAAIRHVFDVAEERRRDRPARAGRASPAVAAAARRRRRPGSGALGVRSITRGGREQEVVESLHRAESRHARHDGVVRRPVPTVPAPRVRRSRVPRIASRSTPSRASPRRTTARTATTTGETRHASARTRRAAAATAGPASTP